MTDKKRLSLTGNFSEIEEYNSTFYRTKIKVFAFDKNRNNSSIKQSVFENERVKKSIFNIPIVAKYTEKEDKYGNEGDLEGHNVYLSKDKDGNIQLKQDTFAFGVVGSNSNITLEDLNEGTEENPNIKTYVVVDNVFLWKRYDATQKIQEWIKNGNKPKVSMEIGNVSGGFSDDGVFEISFFEFEAIAALGSDVEPCFPLAQIESYTTQMFKDSFYEMLKELKESVEYSSNQVKIISVPTTENKWECPHCSNFIGEKELYYDGDSWFHSPCIENGEIILPNSINRGEYFNQTIQQHFIKKEDYGTGDKIEIDLSKEAADTDTPWGDVNKVSLKNKLLKAKNYRSLVSKCYLIVEDGWEDAPSEKLKYPVCMIKNNKLVLSAKGCEAALVRLHGENITTGGAINKLKSYYKTLKLSLENFSKEDEVVPDVKTKKQIAEQFSLTTNQLYNELYNKVCELKYTGKNWYGEEVEYSKYYMTDFDESYVYAVDRQNNYQDVKMSYSKNGDNVTIDFESASRVKWSPVDWDGGEEEVEMETFTAKILEEVKKDFDKAIGEKDELSQKLENQANSLLELNEKFTTLQSTVDEKDTQLSAKDQELETLKEFKLKIETNERQEKVENLFEKYKKHLTKEDVDSFKEKEATFAQFEDLEKEVKLFVADKVAEQVSTSNTNTQTQFTQMGLNQNKQEDVIDEPKNVWERLEQSNK